MSDGNGSTRCGQCRRERQRRYFREHPEKRRPVTARQRRLAHVRRTFGLTPAEYDALFLAQAGRCAICVKTLERPCVDHDHETGKVRGLLCNFCNQGIARLGEDATRLRRAADYLEGNHAHL